MYKTTCTLVALVLNLAMTASSHVVPDVVSGGFIVEGEPISIKEVPWQVSLTNDDGIHFCGGAIISELFILTSAYCLEFKTVEYIKVRSGSIKRDEGGILSNVTRITRHEEFREKRPHHNIALIMLSKPLKFGPTRSPISLYHRDDLHEVGIGELIQFTGWGYTSKPGILSHKLLKANIAIRLKTKCIEYHHVNNFCVGDREEHMYACNGESGGPAVWMRKLYGIVSGDQDVPCHEKEFTTPVTRIADFYDWILSHAL